MSLLMQPCECSICLAKPEPIKPDNSAIRAAFSRLMQWLHKQKNFKMSDLRKPEVRALMDETSKVFSQVVEHELREVKPDDALVRQLKKSGYIFSGFKTAVQMKEAASLLIDENGDFKAFEKFLKDVQTIDETYNEHYLHAEYKFAVGSAQMADKWRRFAADGDRYDLQYRTAGDNRVRDSHAALHNITLPFDSPFWEKYFPPNGWGCRCTVVQVRKGKYSRTNEAAANKLGGESTSGKHAAMFRFNPGKSGNLFPPHGPYMPNNCADCELNSSKVSLVRIPDNEMCQACKIIQEIQADWERKKRMPLRETDQGVKKIMSHLKEKKIGASSLMTGRINLSHDVVKRYLWHARSAEAKWILTEFQHHLDLFDHIDHQKLGEGKDMGNEIDRRNVSRKRKRGVTGYNIYNVSIRGEDWIVGLEVIVKKGETFEQPYYVVNKRKKS